MIKGDLIESESYLNRLLRITPAKDLISWIRSLEGLILYNDIIIIPEVDSRIHGRLKQKLSSGASP